MLLGIRWGGMRAKIIAWSFVPTVLILIAVAWVTFVAYQQVTEELVIERNRELTRLSAGELLAGLTEHTGLLTEYTGLFADLMRTAILYENDPAAQQEALIRARGRFEVFDGGVLVINSRGTVVAAVPERPDALERNWSNRAYFRHMLRSPQLIFSDIVTDGPDGAEVIVVGVPIKGDQDQFLGIMAGMFRLGPTDINPLDKEMAKLHIARSSSAYLVDGSGRVILHTQPEHIGEDFSGQGVVQRVLDGQGGALRTRDLEEREIVASYAPVPGTSWGFVLEESWAALISPSLRYRNFLLLLLALGVIVPTLVVAVGVRRITRPITELMNAAQEVAGGRFGQTIVARTGDEIEELAEHFNLMAAKLRESYSRLEQRITARVKELSALNAIAASVSRSRELEELLQDALDRTLEVMDLEAGGIYLSDESSGTLNLSVQRGFSPALVEEIDRLQVGEGFSGLVAETGKLLVVDDISNDPRLTRTVVKEQGLRCLASAPLYAKSGVLGTLFVATYDFCEFTDLDVQLLSSIGHQVGVAIENARLLVRERRMRKEATLLAEMAKLISGTLDLNEVLRLTAEYAVDVFEVDCCCIMLLNPERGTLSPAVQTGFHDPEAEVITGEEFTPSATMRQQVLEDLQALIVHDVPSEPHLSPVDLLDLQSALVVPVEVGGRRLGVLQMGTHRPRQRIFNADEGELALAMANQAAVAIENARLLEGERRMRKEATLLAEMAKLISGTLDLNEVLQLTAEYAVDVFDVDSCLILLSNEQTGALSLAAQIGYDELAAVAIGEMAFTPSEVMRRRVFKEHQALIVEDVPQEPHFSPSDLLALQSVLVVPIVVGGRGLGAMQLGTHRPRRHHFTSDEGELALAMANQAAVAIDSARLFKAERRRAEQFRVIGKVGRRITSILAVDELLEQMAALIQQVFGYYHVGFGLVEGDVVAARAGAGRVWPAYQALRLKVGEQGIAGWVALTGEPLLVPDVSQEPRYHLVPGAAEIRSELCVPLKTKDAVIGVLDVQSDRLDAFDESDLAVLQSLAAQAAVAVENAWLFRDVNRQVRDLHALADASRIISSLLDQDQLLQALYEQVTRIAPTDFYLIALYDEATNVVNIEINVDEGVHYPKDWYVLDQGLLKLVIHNRQPLLFHSLVEEKAGLDVEIMSTGSPKLNHGWLGVPMLYGDKVVGAIVVGSYQRGAFDERHQQTLTSIANQAAVALENVRLYEQAKQLAVFEERQRLARDLHDAVTQTLFSASLIAEALPRLWNRDQDEGRLLLEDLQQLNRGALAEMRTLLLELRPATLVESSLGDLLCQLAETVIGRTGVPVDVSVDVADPPPTDIHVALYRIAQEALNNVVKHAQASQAKVSLHQFGTSLSGQGVELRVSDDGRGFDPSNIPSDRLGLGIIRERAEAIGATLEIDSRQGQGTQVVVVWEG